MLEISFSASLTELERACSHLELAMNGMDFFLLQLYKSGTI